MELRRTIDRLLSEAIDRGDLMGVAAMVVNRDGPLYDGAFGRISADGAAMQLDTVAAIASMTKSVTGAAAMQLVEHGRLSLDAPAGDVAPYLAEVEVYAGKDADGRVRTRPPASPVTLRQLLTHTAGFVYEIWNAEFRDLIEALGRPSFSTLQKKALEVPLMFDPGTRWEYGIGIDWVGQMVEVVSGQTLGEYFAEHLTGPLGMTDTTFHPHDAMTARLAPVHHRQPDGSLLLAPDEPSPLAPAAPEFEMGGGGLLSTTRDYARFLQMILRGGELDGARVLESDTIDLMSQNHIGDLRVTALPTADPVLSNDAEFFPGDPKSWGLTFQINEVPGSTGRPAGTLMWAGLTNCYYWIDRKNGVAGVFVTQVFPFADRRCLDLYYAMESAVYADLVA